MLDSFDLISDLHVDDWDFNWSNKATSRLCVIAGDVSLDRTKLYNTLKHISEQYHLVLYIDGNEEHRYTYNDLISSYHELDNLIRKIPNVVNMHNNVTTLEGVAFVGTNGWYSMDYDQRFSTEECMLGMEKNYDISRDVTTEIQARAWSDAQYMERSISKLQKMPDVKHIVCVTHFLPMGRFIKDDPDMNQHYRINTSVNNHMPLVFQVDTEQKIKTWCFGHYHNKVVDQVAYTNFFSNPRGRTGSKWLQDPYNPLRVEID